MLWMTQGSREGQAKTATSTGLYMQVLIFILKTDVAYSSLGCFVSLYVVVTIELK